MATIGNNRKEDAEQYRRLLQALRLALNNKSKSAYSIAQQINDLSIADMDPETKSAIEGLLARSPDAKDQTRRTLDAMYKPKAQPVEGEATPGSEAWRAQREINATRQGTENATQGMGQAFGEAKEGGQRIQKRLADLRKNIAEKLAKSAIKKAVISAATSIGAYIGGLSLTAVLPIILGIVLFAVFAGWAWSSVNHAPNPGGGTPIGAHAANPVADRDFIEKLMISAGDNTAVSDTIDDYLKLVVPKLIKIRTELAKPENASYPNAQEIITNCDAIEANLNLARTNAGNATGKKNFADAKALMKKFASYLSAPIEPFAGNKSLPFGNGATPNLTLGIGLHFNTLRLKDNANGHHTYQFYGPDHNSGDAADFYVATTVPILAVMDGSLEKKDDGVYFLSGKDSNNHTFIVTYAHIKLDLESGQSLSSVQAGKRIGYVSNGHLHFEITRDGKPVNYTDADINGTACGGLRYYDIGGSSGNYGSANGSKRCVNYSEGSTVTMASFFWNYTKSIFNP